MHEFSIIQNLLTIILDIAKEEQLVSVSSVTLKIGDLLHIVPDSLVFAFECSTKGTICEGARLELEHVPVTLICNGCGNEFEVVDNVFTCSTCGSGDCTMNSGKELVIVTLDGDT